MRTTKSTRSERAHAEQTPAADRPIRLVPRNIADAIGAGQNSIARTVRAHEETIRQQLDYALEALENLANAVPHFNEDMTDETVAGLLIVREHAQLAKGNVTFAMEHLDELHNETLLPGEKVAS
jgi:hypothetical protein